MKTSKGAYLVAGALNVTEMKAKLRRYSGIPDNNQGDLISFVCGEKHFWEIRLRGLPAAMNSIRIVLLVWAQDEMLSWQDEYHELQSRRSRKEKKNILRANEGVQISITPQVG
jgi:hypothetical protein